MSYKSWIFVVALLGSAAMAKPMIDAGWGQDPALDPSASDSGADASDAAAGGNAAAADVAILGAQTSRADPAMSARAVGDTVAADDTERTDTTSTETSASSGSIDDTAPVGTDEKRGLVGDKTDPAGDRNGAAQNDNLLPDGLARPDQRDEPAGRIVTPADTNGISDATESVAPSDGARRQPGLMKHPDDSDLSAATTTSSSAASLEEAEQGRRAAELEAAADSEKLKVEQQRTQLLSSQLTEAQTAMGRLEGELDIAQAQSADWQKAAEHAKASAAGAQDDASKIRAEATETTTQQTAESRAAAARVDELQHQIDSERERTAGLETDLRKTRTELAATDRQRLVAIDEKGTSDAQAKALEGQLQDERNKTSALAEQLASAAAKVKVIDGQLQSEQKKTSVLADQLASAEAKVKATDAQVQGEQKKGAALADQLAAAQAKVKVLDGQLQDERKKSSALADQLASSKARVKQLEDDAKRVDLKATEAATKAPTHPNVQDKSAPQVNLERPAAAGALPAGRAERVTPKARTATVPSQAPRVAVRPMPPIRSHQAVVTGTSLRPRIETGPRSRDDTDVASTRGHVTEPEGFTSDDYSPYDTSDHTVYIDDVVPDRGRRAVLGPCRTRACMTPYWTVREAKGFEPVR